MDSTSSDMNTATKAHPGLHASDSKATGSTTSTTSAAVPGTADMATLMANAQRAFAQLPAGVLELGRVFEAAGEELALVGGPVRDAFLGVTPHDFDFATSARPERTEEILASWADTTWDVGRDFGTIGARKKDLTVEVTTYRTDSYQMGSRKPEVTYGDTLEGDLTRRDFTVNAMAMRLPGMVLVDPHNGLEDLQQGQLRTPRYRRTILRRRSPAHYARCTFCRPARH